MPLRWAIVWLFLMVGMDCVWRQSPSDSCNPVNFFESGGGGGADAAGLPAKAVSTLSFDPGAIYCNVWCLTGVQGEPSSNILHDSSGNITIFLVSLSEYTNLRARLIGRGHFTATPVDT